MWLCGLCMRLIDTGSINSLHILVRWKEVKQECTEVRVSWRSNVCAASYGISENI